VRLPLIPNALLPPPLPPSPAWSTVNRRQRRRWNRQTRRCPHSYSWIPRVGLSWLSPARGIVLLNKNEPPGWYVRDLPPSFPAHLRICWASFEQRTMKDFITWDFYVCVIVFQISILRNFLDIRAGSDFHLLTRTTKYCFGYHFPMRYVTFPRPYSHASWIVSHWLVSNTFSHVQLCPRCTRSHNPLFFPYSDIPLMRDKVHLLVEILDFIQVSIEHSLTFDIIISSFEIHELNGMLTERERERARIYWTHIPSQSGCLCWQNRYFLCHFMGRWPWILRWMIRSLLGLHSTKSSILL